MQVVELSKPWTLVLDVAVWGAWSALVGLVAWRLPLRRFERDGPLTRLRAFEAGGRWYERRLGVRAWKDRVPEAGALFPGGFSKRSVGGADREVLARFVAETRRAELTHWFVAAAAPLFFLWNWWQVGLVMIAYAVIANGPCIVIQRYNRARLVRILAGQRRGAL